MGKRMNAPRSDIVKRQRTDRETERSRELRELHEAAVERRRQEAAAARLHKAERTSPEKKRVQPNAEVIAHQPTETTRVVKSPPATKATPTRKRAEETPPSAGVSKRIAPERAASGHTSARARRGRPLWPTAAAQGATGNHATRPGRRELPPRS